MASKTEVLHPNQSFPDGEKLFRRVHSKNLKPNGKPTLFAFELPDMSVNRDQFSSAEDARRGFSPSDWGVVAFLVRDIPPREAWTHVAQLYSLLPRHIPVSGNFAHTEVRVRRVVNTILVLITHRGHTDFSDGDPDSGVRRGLPDALLDPDFHMRCREYIAMSSKPVLLPS